MTIAPIKLRFILALLMGAGGTTLCAAEASYWELGVGIAGIHSPDYRGSDQARFHVLPFPYLMFSNQYWRIGRDGVTGFLFNSEYIKLDISANGEFSVDSEKNRLRQGMPNLNYIGELGPSLDVVLYKNPHTHTKVEFNIPVRAVFSTDFQKLEHVGWSTEPFFLLKRKKFGPQRSLSTHISMGAIFADADYHELFYEVKKPFETAFRPAYEAHGGYSGTRSMLSLSIHFKDGWMAFFARHDNLTNARIVDSPLVQSENGTMFGIVWVYVWRTAKNRENPEAQE